MSRHSRQLDADNFLPSKAKVDVIVVAYGKPEFLSGLYKTLIEYDAGVPYNLIVVDNKSPDLAAMLPIYEMLRVKPNVKVILSKANLGFAGGNNLGVARSTSPYILLLNSDTRIMHAGWLKAMTDELDSTTSVGVVGAKLLFFEGEALTGLPEPMPNKPPGKIQHAGVAFNILGQAYHIFLGWSSTNPRVCTRREMNCVTAACLLTRRDLYKSMGGLDTVYGVGNFEDVEYCLRVRQKGYKIIYQPNASLYHYSGGSDNNVTVQLNGLLYLNRCRDIIKYDEFLYY